MKWKRLRRKSRRRSDREASGKVLRFTPFAWAKLEFLCNRGESEVGGFGITSREDLLLVVDFVTVAQQASAISMSFDDGAVADFFESQVGLGKEPAQFARIWCHTHPGNSASPSPVDEATFSRVFGRCDWAVMFILAREGARYARLQLNAGPGGGLLLPVEVDFRAAFGASDHEAWDKEYRANVHAEPAMGFAGAAGTEEGRMLDWLDGVCDPESALHDEELPDPFSAGRSKSKGRRL